jgi:long-chain acyl-CoA synthetase
VSEDFPSLLADLAKRGGEPAASFYRGKSLAGRLSYGELTARAESLAGHLQRAWGIGAGDRVAILAPNRLEIPVLVLALLRLGAVVVPLNVTAAPHDWTYILQHSGARGLCATEELAAQVPTAARPTNLLLVDQPLPSDAPLEPATSSLSGEMAVVLYTSGTTGNPKGVALKQRSLLMNAWSMACNFALDRTTQLAVLPLYHAHAFGFGLMSALSTGGHLVFQERLEPFSWAEVIRAESVAVSSVVPSLLPMLLAARVTLEKVPTLKHLLVSSAPLPVSLARDFESKTGIALTQGWGLSEYTNFACCSAPGAPDQEHEQLMYRWEVPSIGPSLEGTEVRVVDEGDVERSEGERGELQIRGHSTMLGYFQDPDATARVFVDGDPDGWLRTGDEGFWQTHEGRRVFFVAGRIKEIIIRDAEKYSPLRLEARLVEALPEIAGKLVVLGFAHKAHGEEVGAYLELPALGGELQWKLGAALESLPVAERPKVILWGETPIPRTHTGKIQRRKMQPWFADYVDHRGPVVFTQLASTIR